MPYLVPECMERTFIEGIWKQSTEQDSWTPKNGHSGEAPNCIILSNAWIIPSGRVWHRAWNWQRELPDDVYMWRGCRTMLKSLVFRDVTPCNITDLYSTSALRVDDSPNPIIGEIGSFETSVAVYQSTRDNILEGLNIWQQIYSKPHVLSVTCHTIL